MIAHFDGHIPLFKERVTKKIEPKEIEITTRGIPSKKLVEPSETEPTVEAEIAESAAPPEETKPKEEKVVLGEEVQYKM